MNTSPDPKRAVTDHPILDILADRWSPRAWQDRRVEDEKLRSVFEAARWAPSSENEQPWRFLIARRHVDEAWADLLASLRPGNQAWAAAAPVLALGVTRNTFTRNDRANAHARHDLGLATATLTAQAMALGLHVHPMGGILPDEAGKRFEIPEEFDVVTGLAIGYLGDPDSLLEKYREGEVEPRTRRRLSGALFT
ncbi:MAG: nitroreductase family protein [Gemmatimonadota bacterium]